MDSAKITSWVLFVCGIGTCLLLYSCTTTSFNGRHFQHPIMLMLIIFLGELLNLGIYLIIKKVHEIRMEGTGNSHYLTNGDVLYKQSTLFAIGSLDSISGVLLITGMGMTIPTIFVLSGLLSLIVVHLLAHWYRENHGSRHKSIGIFVIVVGIILTTVFRLFSYQDDYQRNIVITGICLVLLGSGIKGISMNIVEHHFKSLNNPALSVTGIKSLYGIVFTSLLYIFFNFIKIGPPFCDYLDNIRDIPAEIENNPGIVFACIALFLVSTAYEASALLLVKSEKPENKIAIDIVRVLVVTPMSLVFEWEPYSMLVFGSGIVSLVGLFIYFDSNVFIKIYKVMFISSRRNAFRTEENSNIIQSSPVETA